MKRATQSNATLPHLQQSLAVIATLRELVASLESKAVALESKAVALESKVVELESKNSALQSTLNNFAAENDLLKRRLFGTKSEHTNSNEFQLVLKELFPEEEKLQKEYERALCAGHDSLQRGEEPKEQQDKKPRSKPKGRRDLSVSNLERIHVNIDDPQLAEQGREINREVSHELIFVRGGFRVLVKSTAVYQVNVAGRSTVLGATQPQRLFPRSMCHESVYAWLACQKFGLGVPHYRLEQQLQGEEESLDRASMGRHMEELGGALGCTVVKAMFDDARTNCHVLSTDATGAAVQPVRTEDMRRQPCKKGHFFTVVADCDHVLYHYTESHTSKAVAQLFEGFSGFLQSDASSVYNILDRGTPGPGEGPLSLVGCWAHCRRYFFDAAITKHPGAVEGLRRIREIFCEEAKFSKHSPEQRLWHRPENACTAFRQLLCVGQSRQGPRTWPHEVDPSAGLRVQPGARAAACPAGRSACA